MTAAAPGLKSKCLLLPFVLAMLAPVAQALSLGQPQALSALGQPLNMSFELKLSPSEVLIDACVKADVQAGEARVPAGLLQLRLEGEPGQAPNRIRLTSLVRIDEPVLQISMALGCPTRFTREFIAVIAPPALLAQSPQSTAPVAAPSAGSSGSSGASGSSAGPAAAANRQATRSVEAAGEPAKAAAVAPKRAAPTSTSDAAHRHALRPKPSRSPRLQLDAAEVLAAAPGTAASSPAQASASEADMEATLARLEQMVAQLQADIKAKAEAGGPVAQASSPGPASAAASEASAASEPAFAASAASEPVPVLAPPAVSSRTPHLARYADPLTWLWTLALSLIAGVIAYQWGARQEQRKRRRRQGQLGQQGRRARPPELEGAAHAPGAAGVVPSQPEPVADSTHAASTVLAYAPAVQPLPAALPGEVRPAILPKAMPWPASAGSASTLPGEFAPARPGAGPFEPSAATSATRSTGVDGLLDLQQQLEFLNQLGQQDAAADLLAARVRQDSEGAMPYLLLMEICQQRGEPQAFAELARRFESRFGGLAPDWASSLARGRGLDASPSVIAHLQVVWSDPAAALAMLRDLVERGAGPGAASFDLPAYRDLLLLYAVARDHFEADQRSDGVDFVLPDTGTAPL